VGFSELTARTLVEDGAQSLVRLMDSAYQALRAFEAIRDMAVNALNQIGSSQEERSMRWKCKACQYVKHFAKDIPLEATGRCPRYKHTEFRPIP
jgi:rubredoxin